MNAHVARRVLVAIGLCAMLAVAAVVLAAFIWPDGRMGSRASRELDVGAVEGFAPGTVTFIAPIGDDGSPITARLPAVLMDPSSQGEATVRINIARLADGTVLAFVGRDPRNGCTLPWRPTFRFEQREGWFRDPCHGSTYDVEGRRVFGPSSRDLDRFPVRVDGGRVLVNIDEATKGRNHTGPSRLGTPTSTAP